MNSKMKFSGASLRNPPPPDPLKICACGNPIPKGLVYRGPSRGAILKWRCSECDSKYYKEYIKTKKGKASLKRQKLQRQQYWRELLESFKEQAIGRDLPL